MFKKLALLLTLAPISAFAASGFNWFGGIAHSLHVNVHIVTFAFVAIFICVLGLIYRAQLAGTKDIVIPDAGLSYRNLVEAFGESIYSLAVSVLGEEEAKKYYSTIIMIFLFIFFSNVIGLVPGFLPPTEDINTTLALGAFSFFYYNYQGIRAQGLWGHIKHFMGPVWYLAFLIFPIEIISHLVRPFSLALRLRGNMYGDHMVLSIFSELSPYLVPIPFYVLGLFVCFIQAFVFTLLTMVYIGLATEHHDHDDH